ncbi:hypothetical protein [Leyella stercorea]|uniref:hypothetical protein n=1 Tax=Leyella stercorea TaxID=363265 RepID=UPI003A95BEE1
MRSKVKTIRTDRCGCLRRPMRMSASTDTDVCVDRCGCLRRPMRMSASTDASGRNLIYESSVF